MYVIKTNKFLGTFVPFDAVNALSGPSTNGFSAGTYDDGTEAFVGHGENSVCQGENPSPARRNSTNLKV